MGFRNPLTSATAVDTGQPAGAGVRAFQENMPGGTRGVLEFRDGIAGDAPSRVTGTANLIPQGDGSYTAQGGAMSVAAGSWNGVPGPRLDLAVEANPAGGYRSAARVVGADLFSYPGAPVHGRAAAAVIRADNGQITIPHRLGVTPSVVIVDPVIVYSSNAFTLRVFARDATNFYCLLYQNNTLLMGGTVDVDWVAWP